MEAELQQLTNLDLTENQIKVIKDKYLKNSPTIEHWLKTVCHNIALGDILYSKNANEEEIFENVNCKKVVYNSKRMMANMWLLHHDLRNQDDMGNNFKIFLGNLEEINKKNPEIISETEKKFYDMLSSFKFLPNSPTLMNAGRDLQQLSACYVLPVEDSIDGIYGAVKNMALIHKSGGGTGFSFSRLRPSGDIVKTTKGVSSGPLSFMQVFDKSTDVVKQGGTRRGANMGILHYTHPDIMAFIDMKKTPGVMENFNVSVTIDEKFMKAVKNSEEYELINPKSKEIAGRLNAKEVWKKLVKGAWETGDPGIIIIDRINATASNATPHIGLIESTNPCVAEGTFVNTPFGCQPVEKLKEGDIISTVFGSEPIKSVEKHENTPVFMVKFSDGGEQIVTAAHRYYAIKKGSQNKNLNDLRLDELEAGDYVRVEPAEIKQNSSEKYLYGLKRGILLGDGCFTKKSYDKNFVKIASSTEDEKYNDNVKTLFSEFNFRKDDLSLNSKSMSMIIGNGREVVQHLNLSPSYSYEKTFNITQVNTSGEALGILDGLLATDGDVLLKSNHPQIRFTTSSGKLAQNIRRLLLMVGCHGRISQSFIDDGGVIDGRKIERKNFKYSVCVSGNSAGVYAKKSMLLKIHPQKGKKLKEIMKSWMTTGNTWKAKIISIEPFGFSNVYDLYCEKSDTWITDGYVQRGCGEQPLLPYEPCNLGSINLSKFVKEPFTPNADFDFDSIKECVYTCTHFLDNVIDVNNYPIPEIEEMAKKTRRIGLGVMGWAESLVMMGMQYNSPDALRKAEEVMKFINVSCLNASEELAESRGVFPAWKGSVYDREGNHFRGQEFFPRHSARTTIAPTGTIGITAGLQGAGIEPFFAVVYVRYNAAGIDALKKGEKPLEKDTFFEVNPLFEKIARENDYFGFKKEELYIKINNNHKTLVGIEEIPKQIQNLFLTSHDLNPKEHVMMQCAFQRHVDNAVSKTVNMKNEATEKDVEEVYMLAYENGAKGVTIYRDGSKQFQVLNISDNKNKEEKKEIKKQKRFSEKSDYYLIETGQGAMHIHINYDDEGPTKVFANLSPTGTEISGMTTALAILLSKYLELGGDPVRILKHLNSIKSEKPYGFGKNRIDSVAHAVSVALRKHLIKTGKVKTIDSIQETKEQTKLTDEENEFDSNGNGQVIHCSQCFSSNVGFVSGCTEPTCFDCGYSKCS
ncbi:hypothetical protein COU59_01360 [Candidatus Pacearchaeota archaeon CG10_big_fil_rev_8_21_14_0_10_34_12]|nr:MAG: hypothetical protein COU59_01360 [Candidatus Pacearchaeota archaeon CG10_big_fil_rev_8_21_14_0_10_34_12]